MQQQNKSADIAKFNNTAEANIIGGLALYPEETVHVFNELTSLDFEDIRFAEIFDVIRDTHSKNETIDVALICSKFTIPEYKIVLARCAEIFISLANYNDYIHAVKSKAQERRIRKKVEEIYITPMTGSEIIAELSSTLEQEKLITDNKRYDKHYINQYSDYINSKQSIIDGHKPDVFSFGINRLDKFSGGLKRSTISTVGALPSTGKTDFGIQAMIDNCFKGKKTMFFTIEMSEEQFLDRVSAQITDVSYSNISKNEISEKELSKISIAMANFYNNKPLIFDDVNSVEAIAKIIYDNKPDFVCIDYLQIISTQKKLQSRNYEIEYIGNTLKGVAKDCNAHIMLLSQLRRISSNMPTMQDLRDSGSIEQQSDYIMLLHRPFVSDKEAAPAQETKLILDKNKYGQCGIIDLSFDGENQKFYEVDTRF